MPSAAWKRADTFAIHGQADGVPGDHMDYVDIDFSVDCTGLTHENVVAAIQAVLDTG